MTRHSQNSKAIYIFVHFIYTWASLGQNDWQKLQLHFSINSLAAADPQLGLSWGNIHGLSIVESAALEEAEDPQLDLSSRNIHGISIVESAVLDLSIHFRCSMQQLPHNH